MIVTKRSEKPRKCEKCGSTKIKISFCEGAPCNKKTGQVGHLATGIGEDHGFVCKTAGEHFHYFCHDCGYARYRWP